MTCEVIRDLLPLCADGVASEETEALVRAPVRTCPSCEALYKKMCRPMEPEVTLEELDYMAAVKRQKKEDRRFILRVYGIALGLALLFGAMWLIDQMFRYESWMYDTEIVSRETVEKKMPQALLTREEKDLAKVIFSLPEVQPYLTDLDLPPSQLPEELVKKLLTMAGKDPDAMSDIGSYTAQTFISLNYEQNGMYCILEFCDTDTSGHVDVFRKYAGVRTGKAKESYHAEINGGAIGVWGDDEEVTLQQEECYTKYEKVSGKRQWLDFLKRYWEKDDDDGAIPAA